VEVEDELGVEGLRLQLHTCNLEAWRKWSALRSLAYEGQEMRDAWLTTFFVLFCWLKACYNVKLKEITKYGFVKVWLSNQLNTHCYCRC